MIHNNRGCSIQGHENQVSQFICTFKECDNNRWVCSYCLIEQIHNHGQQRQEHIMKQSEFLDFITKFQFLKTEQNQKEKIIRQSCIKEIKEFTELAQQMINYLEVDLNNRYLKEMQEIIKITKIDYQILQNSQINKIVNNYHNMQQYGYRQEDQLQQFLKLYENMKNQIQSNIQQHQDIVKDPQQQQFIQNSKIEIQSQEHMILSKQIQDPNNETQLIQSLIELRKQTHELMAMHEKEQKEKKEQHSKLYGGGLFGFCWTGGYGCSKFENHDIHMNCPTCKSLNNDMHATAQQLYHFNYRDYGTWQGFRSFLSS
ncbi:hypothetical protein pb186bvf_012301 [Paramecium bursaria]